MSDDLFNDGWAKGRAVGYDDGVQAAREYYAQIAEAEAQQHTETDGEIWIARRIADLIRANAPSPPETEG